MFLLSALPAPWNAQPIPLGSAESKKEINSLRPLRLSGDYKFGLPFLRDLRGKNKTALFNSS